MIPELRDRVTSALDGQGQSSYDSFLNAARPILIWIDYFERSGETCCDLLLVALRSVIAEACACVAMSLVRPAIACMRTEVDVALAWMYYSDHPREWRYVNKSGDGFKLKSDLIRVFEQIDVNFKRRFSILKARKTRREDDPYKLLSAHIHLQNESVLPSLNTLSDIIRPDLVPQLVEIQTEVSEFVSDVCFSLFAGNWVALPTDLTGPLRARMATPMQFTEFIA